MIIIIIATSISKFIIEIIYSAPNVFVAVVCFYKPDAIY